MAGRFEIEGPDLTEATEAEVRSALGEAWSFVEAPHTNEYLDRVAREVARGIDNAPLDCGVALVAEAACRSLVLPSGAIVLSEGLLHTIEDEAELAFVLAHELAHAASADGARPLVGLGLRELAEGSGDGARAWVSAALDLIRLGHGDEREYDADARAVAAMVCAGYDPESASRFLRRMQEHAAAGHEPFAEVLVAHPPPVMRIQRLESHWVRPGTVPDRVNREVFRRMAGHSVLSAELVEAQPFGAPEDPATARSGWGSRLFWVVLVAVALAALAWFAGLF